MTKQSAFILAGTALGLGIFFSEAGLGLLTAMSILFTYAFSNPT